MHGGHPLEGPVRLWWGGTETTTTPPDFGRPSGTGPRNLFRTSDPRHMYRAGGLISLTGHVDKERLHRQMQTLALRMRAKRPAETRDDSGIHNPRIPAGYTYLLQLIAHDMVDSVISMSLDPASLRPGMQNARSRALMLDTLYGAGPDESPQAYEFSHEHRVGKGRVPRVRLRLGPHRGAAPPGSSPMCPRRDLARATTRRADQPAQGAQSWADDGAYVELPDAQATESLIADPRNDSHAMMSQTTVLFHLLHNTVLGFIGEIEPGTSATAAVYRRLLFTRMVVTLIYRNIIEKDVLPRILDHRILDRYRSGPPTFCDGAEGVPVEFAGAAFRFGHAMVRDEYRVSSQEPLPLLAGLVFNPLRLPGTLPVTDAWLVDWARFYQLPGSAAPNFSRRIGPHFAQVLDERFAFHAKDDRVDADGLANRDLLSGAYAGTLSVPALCQKLGTVFPEVRSYSAWKPEVDDWLVPISGEDRDRLLDDPPLEWFVLFEAEHAARGEHLGPVGSIIVAETIFGAMAAFRLGFEDRDRTLRERMIAAARAVYPHAADRAEATVAAIGDIASMPEMLAFLAASAAFTTTPPG